MRDQIKPSQQPDDRRPHPLKCAQPAGALRAAANRRRALRLRLKNQTFQQIAKALGVSTSTAHAYVNDAWDRLNRQADRLRRRLRRKELAEMETRIEELKVIVDRDHLRVLDPALGLAGPCEINQAAFDEQLAAVDEILQIVDRQCVLLGLYNTPPADVAAGADLPALSLPEL